VSFEATVEAVILLSGVGFENGGLCVAHAMTRGMMLAARTRGSAHGEHVAYGLLVQLALDGNDQVLKAEREFLHAIGLPVQLSDFGPGTVASHELQFLAEKAVTAVQHVRNYPRELKAADILAAIEKVERLASTAVASRTYALIGESP
jgi:glycerol dehydrogenase